MKTTLHFAKIEMKRKPIFLEMNEQEEVKIVTLEEVFDKIAKNTRPTTAHELLHNVLTDLNKMVEFIIETNYLTSQ